MAKIMPTWQDPLLKSVEESLLTLFTDESLSGENAYEFFPFSLLSSLTGHRYYCDSCETTTSALRKTNIRRFPPTLHVNLLRMQFDAMSGERRKITRTIAIPWQLELSSLSSSRGRVDDLHLWLSLTLVDEAAYRLVGVILHLGEKANGGHYVAQLLVAQKEYEYDQHLADSRVIVDLRRGSSSMIRLPLSYLHRP